MITLLTIIVVVLIVLLLVLLRELKKKDLLFQAAGRDNVHEKVGVERNEATGRVASGDGSKEGTAGELLGECVKRFQGLVEALSDWVWEVDAQGCYTYVSPQVRNILGYEPHEIVGKAPGDLMPPEEARRISELTGALMRERKPIHSLENINIHKDGRYIILETNGLPYYDEAGNFQGYRGTDRDITVRKQADEALRKSEERLKEAQHIARLGDWELDIRTNTLRWSDVIYELFEIDPEAFGASYESFLNAVHPDDRHMVDDAYNESLKRRRPYELSHRLLMKDGRVKWVHEICRTVYDKEGNPVKSLGVVQDITKSKHAEEKIRHMANHDYLTDLPTMRLARDRLSMAINAARRHKEMVAVMFIDLDGFKAINDTHGHEAGDHVLKHVAKHLVSGVRATNTVARAGGDEFLLIATELHSPDSAALIAEKVLRLVSLPVSLYDKQAVVSASIGIALYPNHGEEVDGLIRMADEAMYKTKNSGKNGYCFAGAP